MIRDYKSRPIFSEKRKPRRPLKWLALAAVILSAGAYGLHYSSTTSTETAAPIQLPTPSKAVISDLPLPTEPTGSGPTTQVDTPQVPSIEPTSEPFDNEVASLANGMAAPQAEPAVETPSPTWAEHTIESGESLARIFKAMNLSPALLHRIVNSSDTAKQLSRVRPGEILRFLLTPDNELQALELHHNRIDSLHITATDEGFAATEVHKTVERRTASARGTIESSLFLDGQAAGLTDAQIMELAGLFGWDVDFALELRKGDRFSLVYEEQFLEGEKLRDGPILAAEFINRGHVYRAIRFEDDDGNVSYFDPEGRNKRRAFIRTPVKFARVSSGFTINRWHPVLKKWRSHKGVDYAAPTGTPIKATGAGKVVFRGWKGGYGRVVIIEHAGRKYSTLYAHMSKFAGKAKRGSKVKQGQVIGYVGQSGLATGPHLHYEFRVNGVHRNPLTVKLPKSRPLPKKQLAAFQAQSQPLLAQLDSLNGNVMVAEANTKPAN